MVNYEYNPGSAEAKDRGCNCPTLDNHHGEGVKGEGEMFWITIDCPLHGDDDPEPQMEQ